MKAPMPIFPGDDTMKAVAVLLSYSFLLLGCYSQAPLVKNGWLPSDASAVFYLADGSYIESKAGEHVRREGGYEVTGSLISPQRTVVRFEDTLHDADIQKITVEHVDVARTSVATALGGVAFFALLLVIGGTIELARR